MELFPWLSQSAAEVGVKGIASRDAGGWGARGQNPRVTASVLQPLPAVVELCPGGNPYALLPHVLFWCCLCKQEVQLVKRSFIRTSWR